jgi:hypothetical protein
MRLTKEELMILRLKNRVPAGRRLDWLRSMTEAECYQRLRELAGADFGEDLNAWESWWNRRKEELELD